MPRYAFCGESCRSESSEVLQLIPICVSRTAELHYEALRIVIGAGIRCGGCARADFRFHIIAGLGLLSAGYAWRKRRG